MKIRFLFLLCFCFSLGFAEELRVHLSTDEKLAPIYIGKIQKGDSKISEEYLSDLEKVLVFDFSQNGMTKAVPHDDEKEEILKKSSNLEAFHAPSWKRWTIPFVLKCTLKDNFLHISAYNVSTGNLKHFPNVPLTGELNSDRKQIHLIADSIFYALFNQKGIASHKILFSLQPEPKDSSEKNWKAEIWECDYDGHNMRQVTKEQSYSVTPVMLPPHPKYKGDQFLYVSYKLSQPKIYIASIKDGMGKRLIDLRGNQLLPAISAQRDQIAFICDASGRADLFLQKFYPEREEASKPIQLFAYPKSTQASPTFSPDGKKLAFVSDKDGSPKIYLIPTHFGKKRPEVTLLTKANKESSCPSWSPDGTKIAYSSKTNGVRQIWIYNFETEEETQITYGPGNKENPSWARDNLHLVYNSVDGSTSELFLMNLNQSEPVQISHSSGKKHYPCWAQK